LLEQQKDHLLQIDSLNEQITIFKKSQELPITLRDLPTDLNETIITELKTELNDRKVLYAYLNYFEQSNKGYMLYLIN